jgi:hypothetical protein
LLAGCAGSRDAGVPALDAERLRAACGAAPCLTADLVARIQPATGPAENVECAVRRRADGRQRLDVARADIVGMSILAEPDGALTVLLPREHAWARAAAGSTGSDGRPTPSALVRFLGQELAYGPLPPGAVRVAADGLHHQDPATRLAALVEPAADAGLPSAKRLLTADGRTLLRIVYDQWKRFDTVQRPSRCTITVDGGPVITMRLVRLRPVAAIAAGGLVLDIPAGTRAMTIDQLGGLLTAPPADATARP